MLKNPFFYLAVLLVGIFTSQSAVAESRPNIVIITTDDMGIETGAYGDPYAKTPHLDQLAAEGVKFEYSFCSQSSCSPSRSTILSGLWPHQSGQIGLEQFGYRMRDGIPTLFEWFKGAGYKTGWFGKGHVGPGDELAKFADVRPFGAPFTIKVKATAERAAEFLKEAGDQPFFLYYNLVDPHAPFKDQAEGVPSEPRSGLDVKPWPWLGTGSHARVNNLVASYYNCVERADAGVGFLLEALKEAGKVENTLVLFTSDGGSPFPRSKTHNYIMASRIPLIMRWPGKIPAGSTRDALVEQVDIAPTVLSAAGLSDIVEEKQLPGHSLLPIAMGETVEDWRSVAFTEHTAHCPHQYFPRRAAFDGRYLLIWNLEGGKRANPFPGGDARTKVAMNIVIDKVPESDLAKAFIRAKNPPEYELIDYKNDPAELHNVVDDPAKKSVFERLKKAITDWQIETDDPLRKPEILQLVSAWHDDLVAADEPLDERGRPRYVQRDYVGPRYEKLMEKIYTE